jgi:hypothetical protein
MIPEDNPYVRAAVRRSASLHQNDKKTIPVVFDLNDTEQAEQLEGHKAAFGHNHTEVEPLGDGRMVLKIYPGGAKGQR